MGDDTWVPSWQSIDEINEQVRVVANSDINVLFLGETGTGKEFYAERIHNASSRKNRPFVVVNCSTLPKERIDSELFGHVKGAFTGATQDYPGKIRQAEGGTVFLDEIGTLPDDCWGNLLRFLQDKEIHPLGDKTATVDIRILAATNKPDRIPADALHRFYRVISLPPLRARREDIPALAREFFESAKKEVSRSSLRFPKQERTKLGQADYDWRGNIRHLKNAVLCAVMSHKGSRKLTAEEVLKEASQAENLA